MVSRSPGRLGLMWSLSPRAPEFYVKAARLRVYLMGPAAYRCVTLWFVSRRATTIGTRLAACVVPTDPRACPPEPPSRDRPKPGGTGDQPDDGPMGRADRSMHFFPVGAWPTA